MQENKSQPKKSKITLKGIGCLGLMAIIIAVLVLGSTAITVIRLFFSGLLGLKPIDSETGEYITIPWLGIGAGLALALLLVLVEKAYYYITEKLKK